MHAQNIRTKNIQTLKMYLLKNGKMKRLQNRYSFFTQYATVIEGNILYGFTNPFNTYE